MPSFDVSLWNALGIPAIKYSVNGATFISYLLPPLICYFVVAVLVVTPQTRNIRIALWPLVTLLALRAALSIDMSQGRAERKFLNVDLVIIMVSIAARTLDWAVAEGPLMPHHLHSANRPSSVIMNALDLIFNIRGRGWEFPQSYIPRETRPADRKGFVFYTFLSAIAHTLMCDTLQRVIVALAPVGGGPIPGGSTIFDESLPHPLRYLRASIISILTALAIYASVQMLYDLSTIIAVSILGHDPVEWPPIFDAPWCATSLNDFWGRRWHQLLRPTFLSLGGYPLASILGRVGMVIGAFLASAVIHHFAIVALNNEMEMWWMLVGFGMMAPGVLAERAFYCLTKRRVGGVLGWFWTMAWLVLWGNVIVEGFARAGMFGSASFVDCMLPVRMPVEHWAADFDVWLHTLHM